MLPHTLIRCWIAGSARMLLSDFACSSKISPAVLESSKELTTSLIAVKGELELSSRNTDMYVILKKLFLECTVQGMQCAKFTVVMNNLI